MPDVPLLISLLAAALAAVRVVRGRAERERGPGANLLLALFPVAVGLAVWGGLAFAQICALSPWSEARLAPAIGMWKGWPLYSPAESGPINGWIYGPVAPLLWSPAALAGTPSYALRIAAGIDVLLLALPLVLAALMGSMRGSRPAWAALLAIGLLPFFYPTWYALRILGTDSAAVALGASGCLVLALPGRNRELRLHVAALLTVLAVWAKLVEGLLPAAQLLWLALGSDPGAVRRYFWRLAIWGFGLSAAFVLGFGPEALVYNMWTIPSHHPVQWTAGQAWAAAGGLVLMTLPLWVGLAVTGSILRRSNPPAFRCLVLFALVAVAVVPLGLMANGKLGGDRNSLHSVYYLLVANVVALAHLEFPAGAATEKFLRWVLPLGALAALLLAVRPLRGVHEFSADTSAEAFAFAQERKGQVYFPWNPLATLLADGNASHFEYGVIDRLYAGVPLSPARLARDMPPQVRWIAYPRSHPTRHLMQEQFPQFSRTQVLENWTLYSVPPAGSPGP